MKNKYYTPEIEEFCVGFEYERFIPKSNHTEEECWEKVTMSLNYLTLDEIEYEIIEKEIRVKYLDEQDILDCGFEQIDTKSYLKKEFINNKEFGRDEKIYFGEFFDNRRYIAIENNCGQFYFMGWLKNKIELEKALKQTNVW